MNASLDANAFPTVARVMSGLFAKVALDLR